MLAPAKLTISLRVTGRLPDGYHTVDAEMAAIDLADELSFAPGDGLEVVGRFARGVPTGETNLVARALVAAGRTSQVRLDKRIPAGAGLGGGSADAAAALRWAGCTDVAVAALVGADVPFCLIGGRARVTGMGEAVETLGYEERVFTLMLAPFGMETAAVYAAWDDLGGPTGAGSNDLEPAALAVNPELAPWRDRLGEVTGLTPSLAGSGSTWFVPGAYPDEGLTVVRTVPPQGP
ncbi:MAG: 4-(cytidine 5'-diphospho)-2-C-methyl-D-erythritol kinase [Acidimicrobiales bacterium]